MKEIRERLQFMIDVGLDYLTIERPANTLSGGESQRIRLATQIGSKLMGVLYILDEPSIGLHQRDNRRLINTLLSLRDLGNTLIVVEHDEETIRSADYMVDIGPAAGEHGGEIVAAGTVDEVINNPNSLTGAFLRGDREIAVPRKRRAGNGKKLVIKGAKANNLKNIDVSFPLGTFVAVSGVSGSGKSSLITDILSRKVAQHFYKAKDKPGPHRVVEGLDHLDKAIDIDQSPSGRTRRSNPATYTGMFTYMRELFASLPEANMRGHGPGSASRRPSSRVGRRSGSSFRRSCRAAIPAARFTCSTSRRQGFTTRTSSACCRCCTAWSITATRWWSSSTTSTCSRPPTGSSTS